MLLVARRGGKFGDDGTGKGFRVHISTYVTINLHCAVHIYYQESVKWRAVEKFLENEQ